ncbi:MAG: hypothetical protein IIZ63_05245 [Caulobacteraceae bacterium]|nr:hypothetical protein [Caulobacteraceae bacterium]
MGKPTLLKVLCGLHPATAGEVRLDGLPLSDWEAGSVRQALGVVRRCGHRLQLARQKLDQEILVRSVEPPAAADKSRRERQHPEQHEDPGPRLIRMVWSHEFTNRSPAHKQYRSHPKHHERDRERVKHEPASDRCPSSVRLKRR